MADTHFRNSRAQRKNLKRHGRGKHGGKHQAPERVLFESCVQFLEALGEKAYASLLDVPEKIDIVNVFRRSEFVESVADQAIKLRVPAIWMQEGVINEAAAAKARDAGIFVVMDQCILKEHRARFR